MATKKGSAMDLSNIGTFSETSSLQLLHPATDETLYDDDGKAFEVVVYSPTSAKVKQLQHEQTNRRIQKASRSRNISLTAEQLEAQQLDLISKIVKDWHLILNGSVPECTPAKVKEVFETYPWIYEQVTNFFDDRRNFLG